MSPLFDVAELVRIGVEDEKTGVAFYSAVAGKADDPELRKMYEELAEQERRHQERFEQMLDDLGNVQPTESHPGEYVEYLRAMLDSRAFPDESSGRRMAEACTDDAAVLDLAVRFERDTLVLLGELRSMVPAKDQSVVDELIREEQSHLVVLAGAKERLGS